MGRRGTVWLMVVVLMAGLVFVYSCGGGGDNDCTDVDGDGYYLEAGCPEPLDCDDFSAVVNPAAEEICNDESDNDCNGNIDCYDLSACLGAQSCDGCIDADDDSYFAITAACSGSDDCDDSFVDVNPAAEEICDDGSDNDCNGYIDCYDFSACAGTQACDGCVDADNDFFFAMTTTCSGSNDCADADSTINPDGDSDGDGVADCVDECIFNAGPVNLNGCPDSDGDGVADKDDLCPVDPNKTAPGVCGCGTLDADSDGDGVADCVDDCIFNPGPANLNGCPEP